MKMKKILCVLLLLAVVMSFAGCAYLDNLRAQQAYLIDGNIHWGNVVYKPLPNSDTFSPTWGYGGLNVTDPDVPVLLSESFREFRVSVSEDCLFLAYDKYYCREDVYDYWAARMEEPFEAQVLGYYYYYWDQVTETGGDAFNVLTKEQKAAVEKVLETVEPLEIGEGWSINFDLYVTLESATEDLMFRKDTGIVINRAGSQYYLTVNGTSLGRETIYQVPAEYNTVFSAIVENSLKGW